MTPFSFVQALSGIHLSDVFNPYSDMCPIHDRADAAASRRRTLRTYLEATEDIGVDTIWMGRDLGYRGGRRTGLALTDEYHLPSLEKVYPGCQSRQATHGPAVAERTASEIWAILHVIENPPLLWNVFPLHPHEAENPLSNRKFSSRELAAVAEVSAALISWLGIKRIVAIGQDAALYASRFGLEIITIRHPSYGGVREFREGMRRLYNVPALPSGPRNQVTLFS